MSTQTVPFSQMMKGLTPYFVAFAIAGLLLFVGFSLIVFPLLKNTLACFFRPRHGSLVEVKTALEKVT